MASPNRILVATDFSDAAHLAEQVALGWTQRAEGELHWVHALEIPLPIYEPYGLRLPSNSIELAREAATKKLAAAAAETGPSASTFIAEGSPAYAIRDRAEAIDADLVVVGTEGRTGLRRAVLGSVAEKTVTVAPCSVLSVKGSADAASPKRIVVGVDFSEEGDFALEAAADLARENGAELRLVHAVEIPQAWGTVYGEIVPSGVAEAAREASAARLKEWTDAHTDVNAKAVFHNGPAHMAILDAAEEADADLIVTGSRGLSGIKHLLLGSVAERTLRGASCSVWIVRKR